MRYFPYLFIIVFLSCSKKEEFKKNENLIFFQSRFIDELGSREYEKSVSKTKSKVKVKYIDDIIYATKFIETNACGTYVGNIEIKKDSIYLIYKLASDEVCTSSAIVKATYIIKNPKEKKYRFSLRYE